MKSEGQEIIHEGSGNVFADLALTNPEERLAKAELVRQIDAIIAERQLSQVRVATLLGIDRPRVSALLRGELDGFSLDRLIRFLNALGHDVDIVVRPARAGEAAGTRIVSM